MTEEQNNSDTGDKNWKEMREKLELYEGKIAEYEAKERSTVFNQAGLDTSKGVGKAVEMMFEGELTVDNIRQYATEEFGVDFGQEGGLQEAEKSQERLNNIQNNSVVDLYNTDVVSQVREIEKSGNVRNSIAAKLSVIEEAKKNSK
jgi:hypothetical protein